MNPAQTDTRILRTPEVLKHQRSQHNSARHYDGHEYVARHATADEVPAVVSRHWPQHAATELISVDRVRAALAAPAVLRPSVTSRIPVPQMPLAVPAVRPGQPSVEVPQPPEPAAEVTVGLLERILGGLRRLRGDR